MHGLNVLLLSVLRVSSIYIYLSCNSVYVSFLSTARDLSTACHRKYHSCTVKTVLYYYLSKCIIFVHLQKIHFPCTFPIIFKSEYDDHACTFRVNFTLFLHTQRSFIHHGSNFIVSSSDRLSSLSLIFFDRFKIMQSSINSLYYFFNCPIFFCNYNEIIVRAYFSTISRYFSNFYSSWMVKTV